MQNLRQDDIVVLIRHAHAPGVGDPTGMRLDNCATQRNLDASGRVQAQRIGERLRQSGLAGASVFTSPWCRCRETAELLGLGPVTELTSLGSFFSKPQDGRAQTQRLRQWLAEQPHRPLILVTHQVNITALTGVVPASGEIVATRRSADGELTVLTRLTTARREASLSPLALNLQDDLHDPH